MRRTRMALSMMVALLGVGTAPAWAVTITEFEVEPGAPSTRHRPQNIEPGPDGNLWYTLDGMTRGVGRLSVTGERFALIGDSRGPWDLAFGPDGAAYWTGGSGIGRRTATGTVETVAHPPSYGVVVTPDGQVVWGQERAVAMTATGMCSSPLDTFVSPQSPCTPLLPGGRVDGLAIAPDGRVWSAWYGVDTVLVGGVAPGDAEPISLPVGSGPGRIAAGADGNMWVTMYDASAIDRITPLGLRTRFSLPPGRGPYDIAAGPDGALWFTEIDGNRIGRITTDGTITEYAVPTAASSPFGITTGSDGALWFTEWDAGKIGRLLPDPLPPAPAGGSVGDGPPAADPGTPPSAGGGGDPPQGAVADLAAPSFGRAPSVAPARLKAARRGGAVVTFALSEAARVELTVARTVTGRRVKGRCVARTSRNRRRASCIRYLPQRTTDADLGSGAGSMAIATRSLTPGRYRASLIATDAAGNTAAPATATFTITG